MVTHPRELDPNPDLWPDPGMAPRPKAWERTPEETDHAWLAFVLYRDSAYPEGFALGAPYVPRKLAEVARILEVGPSTIGKLASAHGWHIRAVFYDRHVDSMRMGARVGELERTKHEWGRMLGSLRRVVEVETAKHLSKSEEDPTVVLTSFPELVSAIGKIAAMTEGLSPKAPEDTPEGRAYEEHRAEEWDLDSLSLEELEALEAVRKKAKGAEPVDAGPTKH